MEAPIVALDTNKTFTDLANDFDEEIYRLHNGELELNLNRTLLITSISMSLAGQEKLPRLL